MIWKMNDKVHDLEYTVESIYKTKNIFPHEVLFLVWLEKKDGLEVLF